MKRSLIKNKIFATILLIIGIFPTIIEKDATVLVFLSFFSISLFLAKKNYID